MCVLGWCCHMHALTRAHPATTELLSKLSGERSRWAGQLGQLEQQLGALPRAALLAAAFISHLPAQPEDVRHALLADWAG